MSESVFVTKAEQRDFSNGLKFLTIIQAYRSAIKLHHPVDPVKSRGTSELEAIVAENTSFVSALGDYLQVFLFQQAQSRRKHDWPFMVNELLMHIGIHSDPLSISSLVERTSDTTYGATEKRLSRTKHAIAHYSLTGEGAKHWEEITSLIGLTPDLEPKPPLPRE